MARAKNAILNAAGDNTDHFITDMENLLNDGKYQHLVEEEDENKEETPNSPEELILLESLRDLEKEKLEDVQVLNWD